MADLRGFLEEFNWVVSVIQKIMINYYNLLFDFVLACFINNNHELIIYIYIFTTIAIAIAIIVITLLSGKAFMEGIKTAAQIGTLIAAGASAASAQTAQRDREDRKKKKEKRKKKKKKKKKTQNVKSEKNKNVNKRRS